LGALTTRDLVALPFLGDRHLAANGLDVLALRCDEAEQLVAAGFGGGAVALRGIARLFGGDDRFIEGGNLLAKLGHTGVETLELFSPRHHLAAGEPDLDD